jgi:hypothetical protein
MFPGLRGALSVVYHWSTGGEDTPLPPAAWHDQQAWDGLLGYDPKKGAIQQTATFTFRTEAIVTKDNSLELVLATIYGNDENGVAFQDPDGSWLPGHADATIDSVEVYDETLPPKDRLLGGVGADLVGKKLSNIKNGGLRTTIRGKSSGTFRYTIIIKVHTQAGDFIPIPAVPKCTIYAAVMRT